MVMSRRRDILYAIGGWILAVGTVLVLYLVLWAGMARGATMDCGTLADQPAYQRVVWVWFENRGPSVLDDAPYMASVARDCSNLTGMYAETHASWPNYMATTDGLRYSAGHRDAHSVFEQVPWHAYMGGMPTPCQHTDAWPYDVDHNAPAWYHRLDAVCAARESNLADLRARLGDSRGLPRGLVWIVPGVSSNCGVVTTCDAFLERWLGRIQATQGYQLGRTVVVVTWDEGRPAHFPGGYGMDCNATLDASCRIPTMIVARHLHPCQCGGYADHYALGRLTAQLLGVDPLGRMAWARPLRKDVGL